MEMKVASQKEYAIGVDIGGTKILLMAADRHGVVRHKKKVSSTGNLEEIFRLVDMFIEESNLQHQDIAGMGIGVPGDMKGTEGIVRVSVQMGWKNTDIGAFIKGRYAFPVFIKNDVNCSALGERWFGNGDNTDHMVYISIGTGLGGAIIANGRLVEGNNYSAGEFGYIVDKEDIRAGVFNSAEGFGNLERKIAGRSLSQKSDGIGCTSRELFREYIQQNKAAVEIVEQYTTDLSILIANLVSILNPEIVIIGGGVSESMGLIKGIITEAVNKLTIFPVDIRLSKLGGEAGAYGCIYYVFYEGLPQLEKVPQEKQKAWRKGFEAMYQDCPQ
ncbi:ROK family protein [Anoxynatronum sibiricum]|uniref:ROK family protein n=1 Tax=Anoxynatronum sibiricum TaxID=210623 RepID=A0ABU9VW83_9CLOT